MKCRKCAISIGGVCSEHAPTAQPDRAAPREPPTATATATGGTKYDAGKLPFDLLPWDALREVARVLMFGAGKYAPRNWEQGLSYSRLFASTQRHLTSWFQDRQDLDPDGTGLNQLAQAAFSCLALLAFQIRGRVDLDDRPSNADARTPRKESGI